MKQHWRSNSSFINFLRHIRQLLWAPSLLHSFVLCLVGDCGKIVIFAIFAKFAAFANFYGAPSLLCALPRWRLWQNCHFRHICQIRQHYLFFAIFVVVCISGHISKSRGIFFCYYVDRHVNIRRKSSYHDGLNPWFISSHNTLQNKRCFL